MTFKWKCRTKGLIVLTYMLPAELNRLHERDFCSIFERLISNFPSVAFATPTSRCSIEGFTVTSLKYHETHLLNPMLMSNYALLFLLKNNSMVLH